jgi:hydrogenase expression/formation protein HypC
VVEINGNDQAIVDVGGVRKDVSLALMAEVAVGDYVIVHVGYALTRLDPEEAAKTLALMMQAGLTQQAAGA